MTDAVIIDIVRTASGRGKPGGALSGVHPATLLAMQDALVYDEPPAWNYPVRESLGAALGHANGVGATGIASLHIIKTITMSQFKTAVLAVAVVAGITTALIQYQSLENLRAENHNLLQQTQKLAELQAENGRLSKLLAQTQRPAEPPARRPAGLRLS